jgi:hypothetical protein
MDLVGSTFINVGLPTSINSYSGAEYLEEYVGKIIWKIYNNPSWIILDKPEINRVGKRTVFRLFSLAEYVLKKIRITLSNQWHIPIGDMLVLFVLIW